MKKLNPVRPGDSVVLVAPSSHFRKEDFSEGIEHLAARGWICQHRSDIFARELYFSGSDGRRADELVDALTSTQARAILFARGGYGAMRILPQLDRIRKAPPVKIVAGFSDATAILAYVQKRWHWPVFYAPSVNSFAGSVITRPSKLEFFKHLEGRKRYPYSVAGLSVLKSGRASGVLTGGCLSLVSRLLGTKYDLSTDDKILFLEDVGEDPYAIDRMLTHLRLAGKFKKLKGLIWGSISANKPKRDYWQMLQSVFADAAFPIVCDFPAGHGRDRLTFPLGLKVRLDTRDRAVTFLQSPFSLS